MKYKIAIAGTTKRTQQCAEALLDSELFEITWILTPNPKPVGRKQILTSNPMDLFAQSNKLPTVLIEKKINDQIKTKIKALPQPDFLLVVDFGYIVPNWLLEIPKIAPLNIHPSDLPRWRGSSPGQFSILFNDKKSAVTLMVMDKKLDHGPIIHQDFFDVNSSWNQEDYYKHAFNLMCNGLDTKIAEFGKNYTQSNTVLKTDDKLNLNPTLKNHSTPATNNILKATTPQPENSPTITAKMIKKEQTFVPWELVLDAMNGHDSFNLNPDADTKNMQSNKLNNLSDLLQSALKHNNSLSLTLERASKAFNPWPHLWTIVKTSKGEKRMKILEAELDVENKLVLKTVHIEGKTPVNWGNVEGSVLN